MPELNQTLDSAREAKQEEKKFLAAIQGIDLDKNKKGKEPSFEEIKRRAMAKVHGKTEEELDFAEIGIGIEEWEDEIQ